MKAIINGNIFDYVSYRPNSYVLFDDTIRKTGPMSEYVKPADLEEEIDAKNCFVMPTFVNGHTHIYGAFLRGWSSPVFFPHNFREILQQIYWVLDGGLDIESSYHSATSFALDNIRAGVTTIFDHHAAGTEIIGTLDALKKGWVDDSGLRGLFCFELSDRFDVDACIRENVDFYEKNKGVSPMYTGMFGMHASLTVSEKTLRKVKEAIGDIPMHVHVAEGIEDEVECEAYYGKRVVERFIDHGIINPNSVFAHCILVDQHEAWLMAENGITASPNPSSNMNGGNGICDYRYFKNAGTPVMLGNDGCGIDMAGSVRNFVFAEHVRTHSYSEVGINDARNCILRSYELASTLLGVKLGRIEEGYAADMLTMEYMPYTPINEDNAWGFVFDALFQQFKPNNVWCAGDQKLKNYKVTLDEEKICSEAQRSCQRIWDKFAGTKKTVPFIQLRD